ncbi:PPE domain-containing protein [Nocardia mexicana]|uniref:PPE family protein n=1 Tax=Nocardia mexicana TaxID=279262 RepID=A0A370HC91_9NOCA|nr:PPE domain-containing protein [Nocardia mexicana]RDI54556.1 PPE family protein [Nocardia mexicana]
MALQVEPTDLAKVASTLAELANATGNARPSGWVLPAGSDPISADHVPKLNKQAADLFNGMSGLLNEVRRTAHKVGGAASEYTGADDEGARRIIGGGSDVLDNPVPEVGEPVFQQPPSFRMPAAGASVDPLQFAQQLRAGPGPGPAAKFAQDIRQYLGSPFQAALSSVDAAAQAMQNWVPVGADAAKHLNRHRDMLDQLGTALGKLAGGIDDYADAFGTAKAKHPTPEEIIAARKRLVKAMRSKDEVGIQEALAKTQEQNARSAETVAGYEGTVNGKNGQGQGSGGGGESDQIMQAIASMLPSMVSSLASAGMSGMGQEGLADSTEGLEEYGYDDYGLGDYGGGGGGGGSAGGASPIGDITSAMGSGSESVSVGPMSMVASSGSSAPAGAPRTPVIEPLSSSSAASAARGMGAGSPMMPYMPMSPGMGGGNAGGNDRNRVVAWHPDRLMYVDDTPHTEQVIGEKPTIAPSVTPPTPSPTNQAPNQSGGSA